MYTAEEKYRLAIERGIIVDPEDEWLLSSYAWCLSGNKDQYYAITEKVLSGLKCRMFLHHVIAGYPIYQGDVIDHIDRNRLNNKRSNLRLITHQQNSRNALRVDDGGVYYDASTGKYRVRISFGCYETEEEAYELRNKIVNAVKDIMKY